MSIRSEFGDMLIGGTARRLVLDTDPQSPTYGDEVPGTAFDVGFTQADGRQLRELGREITTRAYNVHADRTGEPLNVNPKERIRIDGRGDFDVLTVQSIEDQSGFDGLVWIVENTS